MQVTLQVKVVLILQLSCLLQPLLSNLRVVKHARHIVYRFSNPRTPQNRCLPLVRGSFQGRYDAP